MTARFKIGEEIQNIGDKKKFVVTYVDEVNETYTVKTHGLTNYIYTFKYIHNNFDGCPEPDIKPKFKEGDIITPVDDDVVLKKLFDNFDLSKISKDSTLLDIYKQGVFDALKLVSDEKK